MNAMTPAERKLLEQLFDLASLESAPRDADAVRAINEGLQRAPNAFYPLVQTVLVQDEALKRAEARIRELEDELGVAPGRSVQQPSFLDIMRNAVFGKSAPHGLVPTVRRGTGAPPSSPWGNAAVQPGYGAPPSALEQSGSFLGMAAATTAGVVGGALLMNSLRGLFGGSGGPHDAFDPGLGSGPAWGRDASDSSAARDAGIDDIDRGSRAGVFDNSQRAGLFDASPADDSDFSDGDVGIGGDFGGDGGSDSA
jgi:uncharacterized protein